MADRNIEIDITKGIAMFLVIIGHCQQIPYMPFKHVIFSFHMPVFFIISGYLYKRKSAREMLFKDVCYLLTPYILTCIFIISFYGIFSIVTKNYSQFLYYAKAALWGSGWRRSCRLFPDVPSIGAIWFLPAMLICRNVYNVLPNSNRLLWSSIIFVIATVIGRYLIYLPFSLLSGLSAIVFLPLEIN